MTRCELAGRFGGGGGGGGGGNARRSNIGPRRRRSRFCSDPESHRTEKGVSVYAEEGRNHWPAVLRLDAAHLYRLVLEKGVAGARYHGVAEEGILFRDIAGVIGRRLNVPVVSKNAEEAAKHFGWFAHFAAMDIEAASQQTRRQLEWQPKQAGLLSDLNGPRYFEV
jgi:nucleoside-diphosphate-sugar epimerase